MNLLVRGLKEVTANLKRLEDKARKAMLAELRYEAMKLMTESMLEVPVDTGTLKSSNFVTDPEQTGDVWRVRLGYRAHYALAVHEIPAPPLKSDGGRSASHVVGKWKYLEDPMKRAATGFAKRAADGLDRGMSK